MSRPYAIVCFGCRVRLTGFDPEAMARAMAEHQRACGRVEPPETVTAWGVDTLAAALVGLERRVAALEANS